MPENLEQLITSSGGPVKLLRNSQTGPYVYPIVPPEYTNWRDEQHAWQHACVLFNQSYHMTDMYVEGPGALKLFSDVGVNSFKNFDINKGKQFVVCNYDGYVIGDVILIHLAENLFNIVGRPSVHNWVRHHAETGGYDVRTEVLGDRDCLSIGWSDRTPVRSLDSSRTGSSAAPWDSWRTRFAPAYREEVIAFLAAVDGAAPRGASVADAVAAQRIAEAARRSMERRGTVRL